MDSVVIVGVGCVMFVAGLLVGALVVLSAYSPGRPNHLKRLPDKPKPTAPPPLTRRDGGRKAS